MIIQSKDTGRSQRFLTVYNGSGETIPAFAAMEPYGVDAEGNILVRKPTQDDSNRVLINAGAIIGDGDYGTGTNHMAMWAYYSTGDGTPVTGESIGTKAGEWKLFRGYEGFLVWGGAGNFGVDIIQVQRDLTCRNLTNGTYYYYGSHLGPGCSCCGCTRFGHPETYSGFPASMDVTVSIPCIGTRTITVAPTHSLTVNGCRASTLADTAGWIMYGSYSVDDGGFHNISGTYCDGVPFLAVTSYYEQLEVYIYCLCGENINNFYRDLCTGPVGVTEPSGRWACQVDWEKSSAGGIANVRANYVMTIASCSPFSLTGSKVAVCERTASALPCILSKENCDDAICCRTYYPACDGQTLQVDADE